MPSITPSLWFDHDLEDAAESYTSVCPNARIEGFNRTTDAGPGEPGTVLSGSFVLDGTRFIGMNVLLGYPSSRITFGDVLEKWLSRNATVRYIYGYVGQYLRRVRQRIDGPRRCCLLLLRLPPTGLPKAES